MNKEIFKPIIGYEGFYEVSNYGNIKSLPRGKKGKPKILTPCKQNYYVIDLCKGGDIKRWLIHRLVASSFISNPENKPQVNHIDGNKYNNKLENLEWVTRSENQIHAFNIGLKSAKGVKNGSCKLKESEVFEILNDKSAYSEIAKKYNISIPTIYDIKNGRSWTHLTNIKYNKKQILRIK